MCTYVRTRSLYDGQATRASPRTAASSAAVAIRRELYALTPRTALCACLSLLSRWLSAFVWNINICFGAGEIDRWWTRKIALYYKYKVDFRIFTYQCRTNLRIRARINSEWMAEELLKRGNVRCSTAYLPGGGLPVVNMTGDPRGSRLLHWATTLECCNPWRIFLRGYLYRIIFFRGGVACGPPNKNPNRKHPHPCT